MFVLAGRFANVFAGRTFLTPVVDLGRLWATIACKEKRNAMWRSYRGLHPYGPSRESGMSGLNAKPKFPQSGFPHAAKFTRPTTSG